MADKFTPEELVDLRANIDGGRNICPDDVMRLLATLDEARRERDEMRGEAEQLASDLDTERRRLAFIEQNEKALAESCQGLVEVLTTARHERDEALAQLASLRAGAGS